MATRSLTPEDLDYTAIGLATLLRWPTDADSALWIRRDGEPDHYSYTIRSSSYVWPILPDGNLAAAIRHWKRAAGWRRC